MPLKFETPTQAGAGTGSVTNVSSANSDITVANPTTTPVLTLGSGINAAKIGDGSVSTTEYQYINTLSSNAQTQLDGKASKTLPPWIAPTLLGTWVNYGAPEATVGYYINALGEVIIKGMVKDGTIGTAIFQLQVGYRPLENQRRACVSIDAFSESYVDPSGNVITSNGVATWFSISGISFRAEA